MPEATFAYVLKNKKHYLFLGGAYLFLRRYHPRRDGAGFPPVQLSLLLGHQRLKGCKIALLFGYLAGKTAIKS